MSIKNRLSLVIVNFRTPDLTLKCVESIRTWGLACPEDVIVVENASGDDSAERLRSELKGETLVIADRNGGFSAGINIGARLAQNEFLLVLNPDTYFVDKSLERAIETFDADPEVGLIGLDLVYPGGQRQYSARRFYSVADILGRRTPLGRYWPLRRMVDRHMMVDAWSSGEPFVADWVMGTGFVVRRDVFEQIGQMDESYFLYMEDVDLCARVWLAGWKVLVVPGAVLVHDHQRSSSAGPLSWAGRKHLESLRRFARDYRVPLFSPPKWQSLRRVNAG